jgi:hypothetical protein
MSNTCRIYQLWDIDVFPLSIVREPATDDCKPQGTNKDSIIPIPEQDVTKLIGRDHVGRRELRHPPSSNMRSRRRPNI